jgi:6-phosphogluconolactonase/glucosamine-6-phosphate isomerase/deaminase
MDIRHIDSLDGLSLMVGEDVGRIASSTDGPIDIGIPGGRSVAPLLRGILSLPEWQRRRIRLCLVDERLEGETNYDTLLESGLAEGFSSGLLDRRQLLVPSTDGQAFGPWSLVYLGVGEDGHVASLFPGSFPVLDGAGCGDLAVVEDSPKPPPRRVTVTYRGFRDIAGSAAFRLLFLGAGKYDALSRLLSGAEEPSTLPCAFFPREGFDVAVVTDKKENDL